MRPTRDNTTRCEAAGFTVVELLVVVSIIVLLIALLLPAMTRGREQAVRLHCLNRVRQNTAGCVAWANDHEGALPSGLRDNGGEHCIWISTALRDIVIEYVGSADDLACPNFANHPGPGYFRDGVGWVIGYNYLAGHPGINKRHSESDGFFQSPPRARDPGHLPVPADPPRRPPAGCPPAPPPRRGAARTDSYFNTRFGGAHPELLDAAGTHTARVDGSAAWNPIDTCEQYETGIWTLGAYPCLW